MNLFHCGVPSYINALPFIGAYISGALKSDCSFVMAPPKDLNEMLSDNRLPVSIVSSMYYLQNKEKLELVSGFGIGSRGKVLSVLFFYPDSILSLNGVTIALDLDSVTSNRILQWLLTKVKKQNPHFVVPNYVHEGPQHTAFLLIGDRCLAFGNRKGYKEMDLGYEWLIATGLPLPFGVMAASKEWVRGNPGKVNHLKYILKEGLAWSNENKLALCAFARKQSQLSDEDLLSYWSHLTYVFDESYQNSLDFMEKNV